MSLSDSCSEQSSSQRSGCSADSPISLASSPASSASSCDTLLVCGTEELGANCALDLGSGVVTPNSASSHVPGGTATIPPADNGDRIRALMAKYEQVMSADGAQTRCASSDSQPVEGSQKSTYLATGHRLANQAFQESTLRVYRTPTATTTETIIHRRKRTHRRDIPYRRRLDAIRRSNLEPKAACRRRAPR